MSRIKYTNNEYFLSVINFPEIINRIKGLKSIKNNYEIAELLKLSPSDFSNRKKIKTLLTPIIVWAIHETVNINWLLTGNGNPYLKEIENKTILDENRVIIGLQEDVMKILKSGDQMATEALGYNIRYFEHAVKIENRMATYETELNELKEKQRQWELQHGKWTGTERRKVVRRIQDLGPQDGMEERRTGIDRRRS